MDYSQLIDILISKDKKTTIRIDTSQLDYGMTYGDNGGDQEIVLNGYPDSDLKNIDEYAIPGDPMFILAHEMRHAVRAENGVRDSNPDAIAAEANEEAYAILFENMVRNEASPDYGLRGDGDPLDDVDEDGIPDGDGNYGNYDEFYTIGGESDDSYLFITRNLCIGMKGSDVIQLQKNLNKLGYNCGTPTGIFDENTKAAVLAFQKAKGLGQDGIAGTQTRRAINIALQGTGNPTSALIFQSERKKGLDQYGNQANDMKTNDFTKEQLLAINSLFQYQIDEASNSETLFTEFKNMSTQLFSQGEMETVILDMINHFKGGGGTDYSNATLTAQVSAHPTTQAYIQLVKDEFMKDLVLHGGILSDLQFNEATKLTNPLYNYIISNANYPVFNSWADTLGGLKITVNDTWGNNIEVKNYTKDGNKLTGTLHFTIYDHFGLDQPDVEPKYVNIGGVTVEVNFATIAGFRAWYVLQHYNQFNGQYKPFATVMEIDVPFETYLVGSGGQA